VAALLCGATVYPESVFDAERVLARIARDRVHFLLGPPTLFLSMLAHPRLREFDLSCLRAAVIGLPDERMGEVGCACVVLRPGQALEPAALIAWSRERMANYKVPRSALCVDALPQNASGKVDKRELLRRVHALIGT
jgi:acyl-CoA synthetase (AMP-forming)/AMP-acid ligase II